VSNEGKDNFSYLNGDGSWPDFRWEGLELNADGALELYSLPLLEGDLPKELDNAGEPGGPAGIAVASNGTIYFSDPSAHRLRVIDACDHTLSTVACLGGKGDAPQWLNTPRGLLIPATRNSIFIADSRNHRIQVFDLGTLQLVDIWGQPSPAHAPQPGSDPGRFNMPVALAGDAAGNVYVVDYGNRRVQKFDRAGDLVSSFGERMKHEGVLRHPVDIAAQAHGGDVYLYVVDQDAHAVFVFAADGHSLRDDQNEPVKFGTVRLRKPLGIAATAEAIYVGDNERRRVLTYKKETERRYVFAGEAVGYRGPVAALALDRQGNLLVHAGTSLAPVRLSLDKGYRSKGVLWSQAIRLRNYPVSWHRLQAQLHYLAPDAHLRLFVHTSDNPASAPKVDPSRSNPFEDAKWRPALAASAPDEFSNVTDLFIGGAPATYLWVGALFSSDGRSTSVVSHLRVEFDHETYLSQLPAIYQGATPCADFLLRFLSLFETFFGEVEERIGALSLIFDPLAVPEEFLPWLAGWLALELDEDWDEAMQRRVIAAAFEMYGRRGTVTGLRDALRLFAGVDAVIEEPVVNAALWALPAPQVSCGCKGTTSSARDETVWEAGENSILGVTTMLAPAEPQGAITGTTAILDRSHLITDEQFGAPLFEDVAHQFSVQIYQGQLRCAETLARVRAVIEREKPAHTSYHLCIIEPRLRVGFQARVGIDTVVAGPPLSTKLGDATTTLAVEDVALGGPPASQIGSENRVGVNMRLG
jgi:phage tail-like protein